MNPPVSTVRGGASLASHRVNLTDAVSVKARWPSAIVYLQPKAEWFRRFYRFVAHHNIGVVVWGPEECGTYTGVKRSKVVRLGGPLPSDESITGDRHSWEVVGDVDAIASLLAHDCVRDWHGLIACSVRWSGQGNGAEKVKASKPREKDKRDALTRAVVSGNECDEHGVRVASWAIQSVPAVRPLEADGFDYWAAQSALTDDGCPHCEC